MTTNARGRRLERAMTPPIPKPSEPVDTTQPLSADALRLLIQAAEVGIVSAHHDAAKRAAAELMDQKYISPGGRGVYVITVDGRRTYELMSYVRYDSSTKAPIVEQRIRTVEREREQARLLTEKQSLDIQYWKEIAENRAHIIEDMEQRHQRALAMAGSSDEAAALRFQLREMTELAEARQRRIDELSKKS